MASENLPNEGATVDPTDIGSRGCRPLEVALSGGKNGGFYPKKSVEILLKNGAEVNAVDSEGRPLLCQAVDSIELLQLLIHHGVDVCLGNQACNILSYSRW